MKILSNNKLLLLISVLFILLIRISYVILYFNHNDSQSANWIWNNIAPKNLRVENSSMLYSDAVYYDLLAKQFSQGSGLEFHDAKSENPVVFSPGYPFFLGVIYTIFGQSILSALLANVFLDVLSAIVIILTFRIFYNNKYTEYMFLFLFAVFIPVITNTVTILTESLYTFLLSLFFYTLALSIKNKSSSLAILAGFVMGLATLTRPITLIFGVTLLLFESLKFKGIDVIKIRTYFIVTVMLFLTILPWTVKNYVLYDKIILINSNSGLAYIGTDLKSSGGELKEELADSKVQLETQKTFLTVLKEVIYSPFEYSKLFAIKFIRLWLNLGYPDKPSPGSVVTGIFQIVILAGTIVLLLKRKDVWLNYAPQIVFIIYLTLFHVFLFTAKLRFVIPVMPFMLLFISIGIVQLFYSENNIFRKRI